MFAGNCRGVIPKDNKDPTLHIVLHLAAAGMTYHLAMGKACTQLTQLQLFCENQCIMSGVFNASTSRVSNVLPILPFAEVNIQERLSGYSKILHQQDHI